jgi:hypothetical protein
MISGDSLSCSQGPAIHKKDKSSSDPHALSDCAIAQAFSHRLTTSEARVWSQLRSCGVCGGQRGSGAGLIRLVLFPLPIFNPPTAPYPIIDAIVPIMTASLNNQLKTENKLTPCFPVSLKSAKLNI